MVMSIALGTWLTVISAKLVDGNVKHRWLTVMSTRALGWQLWTNSPNSDATIVLFLVSGFSLRFTGQRAQKLFMTTPLNCDCQFPSVPL